MFDFICISCDFYRLWSQINDDDDDDELMMIAGDANGCICGVIFGAMGA